MDKLYTVVIVDDEATISEGLSRLVKVVLERRPQCAVSHEVRRRGQ